MKLPDPLAYGFKEGEVAELLRSIIDASEKYWQEDDDNVEWAYAHACWAQGDILRFAAKHGLQIAMPGYDMRFKRAIKFIELENDDKADINEYVNFGPVDSLGSLCDDVILWLYANGVTNTDELIVNVISFYENSFWFDSEREVFFQGHDGQKFQALVNEVRRCHAHNENHDD